MASATLVELQELTTKLNYLEETLTSFFQLSPDLMCIADDEGLLRAVNQAWTKVLGYKEDELLGRNYMEFVHPEDLSKTCCTRKDLHKGVVTDFTNRYIAKDGKIVTLEWTFSSYRKEVTYAVGRVKKIAKPKTQPQEQ